MIETLDQAVWQVQNKQIARHDEDIRMGDITDAIQSLKGKLAVGEYIEILLGNTLGHAGCNCVVHMGGGDRRLKQHTLRPPEKITEEATRDISIFLNAVSFKKHNHSLVGLNAVKDWEANILRQIP